MNYDERTKEISILKEKVENYKRMRNLPGHSGEVRTIDWTIDLIQQQIDGKIDQQQFERIRQIIKERGETGRLPIYEEEAVLDDLPDLK